MKTLFIISLVIGCFCVFRASELRHQKLIGFAVSKFSFYNWCALAFTFFMFCFVISMKGLIEHQNEMKQHKNQQVELERYPEHFEKKTVNGEIVYVPIWD